MLFRNLVLAAFFVLSALSAAPEPPVLKNGVYAVLNESPEAGSAVVPGKLQVILLYDRKYAGTQDEQPKYVSLSPSPFVPLILAGPPEEAPKDERGWTAISVTLAREHVKALADFSRAHLGGRVAIVLDNQIVTLHKVRAAIEDGRFVVSRCTDNACDFLRSKLK